MRRRSSSEGGEENYCNLPRESHFRNEERLHKWLELRSRVTNDELHVTRGMTWIMDSMQGDHGASITSSTKNRVEHTE